MDRITELEQQIAELQQTIATMDKSAKMLIHRDLELKNAYRRLRELDHNKSEFVSIAAHQMRTPLSAINWSQQMLKKQDIGPLNENQLQIVTQTLMSVSGLITLVNNMLTVDQIELGKDEEAPVRFNLTNLINEVIAGLFSIATRKHIKIEFPQSDIPMHVMANKERIADVFQNLLDNAIKYTKEHGQIIFSAKMTDVITVSITDTGVGIPVDYQGHIFSRFTRAENAKRIDPNGSGLGLYIVKRIIDANNGTITFKSEEGKGTTFTITLPKASD